MEKINVRGVRFLNVTPKEAEEYAKELMHSGKTCTVFTPNAEIVQLCIEQPRYFDLYNGADLVVPDGAGVVKAARILGTPLKGKVAGIELGERLLADAAERGEGVYFLGGKPGIAETAAQKMTEKYPGLRIVGSHDGYFKKRGEESDAVIELINQSGAKLLFVCLGVPAQEEWISANADKLTAAPLCLCLGGSLDVYAGAVKRAPKIFIKLSLEWFYRLCKEPWRLRRMMKLPKFILGTCKAKIFHK